MKTTLYVHIATVQFATQLTESPCSPVVTFPSLGLEGHGVQRPQGDSVFIFLWLCYNAFIFLSYDPFYFPF